MASYFTKRLVQAILTTYVVITLSFVLIQFMPGGVESYITAQIMQEPGSAAADAQEVARLAELYVNLPTDQPLYVQYVDYMTSMAQGDFGRSVLFGAPVSELIADALPWTIFVMTIAITMSFLLGIVLGGVMALYEGGRFDLGTTVVTLFTNSVPYYVVALFLLLWFSYGLGLFPVAGRVSGSIEPGLHPEFVASAAYHAALPALSIIVARIGGLAITMRSNSISVLGEDYMRVARLRGLPDSRIALRYVVHNAVLPMYTGMMIAIGGLFGGSIILEMIFRYEGIGWYFFEAISARDYPLMMGAFVLTTVTVVIGIMIADLTYGLIDPRISNDGGESA